MQPHLRDVNYSEIFEASGAHAQVVTEAVNIKDALNNASEKIDIYHLLST